MTISQAILWAASNVEPEKKPSEIMACDPYFIGSHSGASGAWVSGPEDLQNAKTKGEYFWGYAHMTTVDGLFAAGDASGASSHKFSSGSHAEGRIAAKAALAYIVDHKTAPKVDQAQVDALTEEMLRPIETFEKYKGVTTAVDINPNYIRAKSSCFASRRSWTSTRVVCRASSRPATSSSRGAWSCSASSRRTRQTSPRTGCTT
jgi:adenylylsulfate reductase subunit A